ncbi:MAG: hypothetical protein PWP15_435 [Methanothermococcus sp.]|jgi:hypothetical protein|uniref:hypothetical protein n=1 Tax=Methanothermococcus TaxID=155862 RepID=UPI00037E49F2|nr:MULTISPECIES: hypothetical protein [Methanothermococcus]MDK2789928.1 hypothetical protein [Methanothermococcus sp.]MDK2987308.1 hypothetical protein [Methanothermococcus sp.]
MKEITLGILLILLSSFFCLCIDVKDNGDKNLEKYGSTLYAELGNNTVPVPLRTTINNSMSTVLINTNDSDIKNYYMAHKIIYLEFNESLPNNEGGVTVTDLIMKLTFLNNYYPHVITDKSIFNDTDEINAVKASNKTMVIEIVRGNRSATIEKYNNTFLIEGNSLEELDKAETRFIIAILN